MVNEYPNFQKRENAAYQRALEEMKNKKRAMIRMGLANSPEKKTLMSSPKKASPLKRSSPKVKSLAKSKPVQVIKRYPTQASTVGVHTGKKLQVTIAPKAEANSNFSLNKQDRLKIKGKLCSGHSKNQIQEYLKKSGITYTQKATKDEMCAQLKKKCF